MLISWQAIKALQAPTLAALRVALYGDDCAAAVKLLVPLVASGGKYWTSVPTPLNPTHSDVAALLARYAAYTDNCELLEALIKYDKLDVNNVPIPGSNGGMLCLLSCAAGAGNLTFVKLLVANGANIETTLGGETGSSPREHARDLYMQANADASFKPTWLASYLPSNANAALKQRWRDIYQYLTEQLIAKYPQHKLQWLRTDVDDVIKELFPADQGFNNFIAHYKKQLGPVDFKKLSPNLTPLQAAKQQQDQRDIQFGPSNFKTYNNEWRICTEFRDNLSTKTIDIVLYVIDDKQNKYPWREHKFAATGAHTLALPEFGGAAITVDCANKYRLNKIVINNLDTGKHPLHVRAYPNLALTLNDVSSDSDIFVYAPGEVTANKVTVGDAKHGGSLTIMADKCHITADCTATKDITVHAQTLELNKNQTIQAGNNVYLIGKQKLDLHGKLAAQNCIGVRAEQDITYDVYNLNANQVTLQLAKVAQMQFPHNVDFTHGLKHIRPKIQSPICYELIGNDTTPIKILNDSSFVELHIKARGNELLVGDASKRAIVIAPGKLLFDVKSIDAHNGGIFACEALVIRAPYGCSAGRIDFNATVGYGTMLPALPSFIAAYNYLFIDGGPKFTWHHAEVYCYLGAAFLRATAVENISSKIGVLKEAFVDIRSGAHTLVFENLPTGPASRKDLPMHYAEHHYKYTITDRALQVKSPPAEIMVYGVAHLAPNQMEVVGSTLYAGEFSGPVPTQVDSVTQCYDYRLVGVNGHEKEYKAIPYNDAKTLHPEQVFQGRVISDETILVDARGSEFNTSGKFLSNGELRVLFDACELGVAHPNGQVVHNQMPTTLNIFGYERPTYLYTKSAPGSASAMVSILPPIDFGFKELEPLLLYAKRFVVGNPDKIPKHYPLLKELEDILPAVITTLGNASISGNKLQPTEVLGKLQHNALNWLAKNPQFKQYVTADDIQHALEPMVFYVVQEDQLYLHLHMPKHLQLKASFSNSGLFFGDVIRINGTSLKIYGEVHAVKDAEIRVKNLQIIKPKSSEAITVTERRKEGGIFGSTTTNTTRELQTVTLYTGGVIHTGGKLTIQVEDLVTQGATLTCDKGDVVVEAENSITLNHADGVYFVEHTTGGKSALKRVRLTEFLERHIIAGTTVSAPNGNVLMTVLDGDLTDSSAQFFGQNVTLLVKNGDRISRCAVVREDVGTNISRRKLVLTESHGFKERAVPTCIMAAKEVTQQASGMLDLTAPIHIAEQIILQGAKGVKISAQILQQYIALQASGIANYSTYFASKTLSNLQSAAVAAFAGCKLLRIESDEGAVELQASVVQGGVQNDVQGTGLSRFEVHAKTQVRFTSVDLQNTSTTTTNSIGLKIGAMEAVAAAIDGNLQHVLKSLANEVPLLQPLVALSDGGHMEDYMAQGMLLVYRLQQCSRQGGLSGPQGFADYLLDNFGFVKGADGKTSFNPSKIKVETTVSTSHCVAENSKIVGAMLAILDTVIQAGSDVDLHSVQADGKTFRINSGGNIVLVADSEHGKMHKETYGATLSMNEGKPAVGANIAIDASNSRVYATSAYRITDKVALVANSGSIDLRNTLVTTAQAVVIAKRVIVQTMLDEHHELHKQASFSTDGNCGVGASTVREKWANTQAGIKASDGLYVKASEQLALNGGLLGVTSNTTPLVTKFGTKLYPITMPQDNDELFHALGVSRIKATADLLDHVHDTDIRRMVGNDIEMLLRAGKLPSIMQNSAQAQVILAELQRNPNTPLLATLIREYSSSEENFRAFVSYYVGGHGVLFSNPNNRHASGTIDAIAKLNNLKVTSWVKNLADDKLILNAVYNHAAKSGRVVDLLLTVLDAKPDADKALSAQYSLLTTDPTLIITPVITHATLRGSNVSSGFSFSLSAGKGNESGIGMGTMYRSEQEQFTNAAIFSSTGKAVVINPQGAAHNLSGIANTLEGAQVTGEKQRFGVGFAVPVGGKDKPKEKPRVSRQEEDEAAKNSNSANAEKPADKYSTSTQANEPVMNTPGPQNNNLQVLRSLNSQGSDTRSLKPADYYSAGSGSAKDMPTSKPIAKPRKRVTYRYDATDDKINYFGRNNDYKPANGILIFDAKNSVSANNGALPEINLYSEPFRFANLNTNASNIVASYPGRVDTDANAAVKGISLLRWLGRSALTIGGRLGSSLGMLVWPSELATDSQEREIAERYQPSLTPMYKSKGGAKDDGFGRSFVEGIAGTSFINPPPPDDEDLFDRMIRCNQGEKYSRIKGTNLWATIDRGVSGGSGSAHGDVYWKIYKQIGKELVHQYEADEFFNVINKHKGPSGLQINISKECRGVPGWKGG